MLYNNCNECPNYKKDSCPFAHRTENQRRKICQLVRLGSKAADDVTDDYNVDLMAQRILDRIEAIREMQDPEPLKPKRQEMDYSRNDTKQIVNSMRPYNN